MSPIDGPQEQLSGSRANPAQASPLHSLWPSRDYNEPRHQEQVTDAAVLNSSIPSLRRDWDLNFVFRREFNRSGIARIGVAEDAHPGIAGENALEAAARFIG